MTLLSAKEAIFPHLLVLAEILLVLVVATIVAGLPLVTLAEVLLVLVIAIVAGLPLVTLAEVLLVLVVATIVGLSLVTSVVDLVLSVWMDWAVCSGDRGCIQFAFDKCPLFLAHSF